MFKSSEDLSAIHDRVAAAFAEVYAAHGEPAELDDAFFEKYFKAVGHAPGVDGKIGMSILPQGAEAKLHQSNQGLVDLVVPSVNDKFHVSGLQAVETVRGACVRSGQQSERGKGEYSMKTEKGFPVIVITMNNSRLFFTGNKPFEVAEESGKGEWVRT